MLIFGLVLALQRIPQAPSDPDPLATFGLHVVKPMSAEETARTRAQVDAELVRAKAADAFEDVTTASGGLVRHKASGLTCPLGKSGQTVEVLEADGAVCRTREGADRYETRVAHAPEGATLDRVADDALQAAKAEPGFKPSAGVQVYGQPRPGSGRPPHRTFRFTTREGWSTRANRLQVGLFGGWLLTERKSGPAAAGDGMGMGEVLSEATFGSNLSPPAGAAPAT